LGVPPHIDIPPMPRRTWFTTFVMMTLLAPLATPTRAATDLLDLSLEELMEVRVIATAKFAGRVEDIPASVSILTAQDIRLYGWRTLADALRSLRGFNVSYDHVYAFTGARGIAPPGDFKPRLTLLIDGIESNENIYDSALVGGEFPLDLDLVERIEVIRGPGATAYGSNASSGVVNVVTRGAESMAGVSGAVTYGQGPTLGLRATMAGRLDGGLTYLASFTGYDAEGRTLLFPDMAALGDGTRTNDDDELRQQAFIKLKLDDWHATLIHGKRKKQVPTGSYGTIFNDPAHYENDTLTLAEVGRDTRLNANETLALRAYTGRYVYEGYFPYDYEPPYFLNHDRVVGAWWGLEARWQSTAWTGHRLTAGLEYRDNTRQDQLNNDIVASDPGTACVDAGTADACLNDKRDSQSWAVYAQDEIELGASTRLTLGLRHDRAHDGHWSPRLGLTHHHATAGTFKLLYAEAFREANAYERYYVLPALPAGNSKLDPEHLRSLEGIWEYELGPRTRLSASLYTYHYRDLILLDEDGIYQNTGTLRARGAEFELDHHWGTGATARASYTRQYAELDDAPSSNVPRDMIKLNLGLPLSGAWTAGFEAQAIGSRYTETGARVESYRLANLNLIHHPDGKPWEVSLGIHNLFDSHFSDPVAPDPWMEVERDRIVQPGRSIQMKFTGRF
jgi:iron complex outermembrane receptor protein